MLQCALVVIFLVKERIVTRCRSYIFNPSCTDYYFFFFAIFFPSLTFLLKLIVIYTCRYLFWSIHVNARWKVFLSWKQVVNNVSINVSSKRNSDESFIFRFFKMRLCGFWNNLHIQVNKSTNFDFAPSFLKSLHSFDI